jgi:thioredoxin-related protein
MFVWKVGLLIALTYVGAISLLTRSVDPESGIQFQKGSWNEVLLKARTEKKLIFLDISASWCGPCKLLKKNTFPDEAVGAFYNAHFINVALDGELGEGKELAQKYAIKGYPTLLFIDDSGNVIVQSGGYRNADNFLKLGREVIEKYGEKAVANEQ